MASTGRKIAVASVFTLILAGCGTTTPVPQIPPGVTGGVAIGAAAPVASQQVAAPAPTGLTSPAPSVSLPSTTPTAVGGMVGSATVGATGSAGMWELRNSAGETCQVNLSTTPSGTSFVAAPAGICSMGFGTVAAWSEANGQLFLFDSRGALLGRFFPDGAGGFTGTFGDGVFSPQGATMRRL